MPEFNWTPADLKAQLLRAHEYGWMNAFEQWADRYNFPTELLLAIASRETDMQDNKGDFHNGIYHGFGIMQVDIGTDSAFCASWKPGMVSDSIRRGTEILNSKRLFLHSHNITDLRAIAAAYNTGEGNVLHSIQHNFDPDHTTAHGNYGADVMARMDLFRQLRTVPSEVIA
jgi:hypothetical protein